MKKSRKSNLDQNNGEDASAIHSFLALAITLPILFLIGYFLGFIPDVLDTAFIKSTYNLPLRDFLPEKSETVRYVILSVLFPVLYCLAFRKVSSLRLKTKRTLRQWNHFLDPVVFGLACAVCIWAVVGNYYGVRGFTSTQNITITVLIVFVLVIGSALMSGAVVYHEGRGQVPGQIPGQIPGHVTGPRREPGLGSEPGKDLGQEQGRMQKKTRLNTARIVLLLVMIGLAVFTASFFVTEDFFQNGYTLHHFDAYFYPVFEVYHGRTLMIDFQSLYGFYPYLMVPFFKMAGGVTMAGFGIFMAVLVLINAVSAGLFLWLNLKNKIIALLGFGALLCTMFYASFILNSGYYLQYTPHRTLFPCLLLLLCTIRQRTVRLARRRILTAAGFLLAALALFWNIDSGVVVAAGWCLFLLYQTAVDYELKSRQLWIRWAGILGATVLSVGAMVIALLAVTFLRTGQLVTLEDMIAPQILFKGTGFFMLPMKLRSPWVVLAVVYCAGLVISLRSLSFLRHGNTRNEALEHRNAMVFLVAILGVGLFSYYQGRSHRDVLIDVLWPGILLLAFFAQACAEEAARGIAIYRITRHLRKIPLFTDMVKLFVLIGVLITIPVSFTLRDLEDSRSVLAFHRTTAVNSQKVLMQTRLSFIRLNTEGVGEVHLLTLYFAEYYSMLGISNPMPIRSSVDWVTKEDYQKVIDFLETVSGKVFMDKKIESMLTTYAQEPFKDVMRRRFKLVSEFSNIRMYIPATG